jgi:GNAT superfamily N-acetyltransferase
MPDTRELVTYELAGLDAGQLPPPPDLPPGIALRPADLAADLPEIEALAQIAFSSPVTPAPTNGGAENQAEVGGLIRHPGLAPPGIFLALHGGLAVGLAVGRVEVPAAGDGTRRAAVELVAVHPGYRRGGIARALLRRLLAWLAERGVQTVVASTDDPIVVAMLQRHGFQASTPG